MKQASKQGTHAAGNAMRCHGLGCAQAHTAHAAQRVPSGVPPHGLAMFSRRCPTTKTATSNRRKAS